MLLGSSLLSWFCSFARCERLPQSSVQCTWYDLMSTSHSCPNILGPLFLYLTCRLLTYKGQCSGFALNHTILATSICAWFFMAQKNHSAMLQAYNLLCYQSFVCLGPVVPFFMVSILFCPCARLSISPLIIFIIMCLLSAQGLKGRP